MDAAVVVLLTEVVTHDLVLPVVVAAAVGVRTGVVANGVR